MYKTFLALRAILYYLWLAFSTVFFTLLLFITLPLPFRKAAMRIGHTWCFLGYKMAQWICGIHVDITGLENCPKTPIVYIVKHQSAWETIALTGLLPPSCFVAKSSLLNIPFFGWGMRICKNIPIDRKMGMSALKKVLRLGRERIKRYQLSIIIFPEGTRVAPGLHPKFHRTATMLAKEAGVPIIPIAHNAGSYWRRNSFLKYPGTIKMVIGKPIDSSAMTLDALNQNAYEWIKSQMLIIEKGISLEEK